MVRKALLFIGALSVGGAFAAQESISEPVSIEAVMEPYCELLTQSHTLAFGSLSRGFAAQTVDAQETLRVQCSKDTNATLTLDGGLFASAAGERRLANVDADHVRYMLYSNASYSETIDNDSTIPIVGSGLPEDIVIYGRLTLEQNVPSGDYSDTVTIVLSY